jgi:Domain of unknown function (DUF4252)
MRMIRLLMLASVCSGVWAQSGAQLDMKLQHLEEKADEVVSVNLEGESLDLGRKLLAVRKGVTAPVRELVKGIKGIYMRRFWFGKDKDYDPEDTDGIRQQMSGPGWVPMINVQGRNRPETLTVYSYMENEKVAGVTVLSQEKKELTVVNIVGPVDLETLVTLGEQMGLPAMKIATTNLPRKKALPPVK